MFSALAALWRTPPEKDAVTRAFARCFHSDDGKIVLDYLNRHVLCRTTDPAMPPAQLRFLEGQRQTVLLICKLATPTSPNP